MNRPTVLISGASIAGPALASWLTRYRFDTTIVERAPAFRSGGQNIDIRGAPREVLRRAGLEEAVRNATTGEIGTRFIGNDGKIVAEFPALKSEAVGSTPNSKSSGATSPGSSSTPTMGRPNFCSAIGSPPSTTPVRKSWCPSTMPRNDASISWSPLMG
jgi:hypothetical protein